MTWNCSPLQDARCRERVISQVSGTAVTPVFARRCGGDTRNIHGRRSPGRLRQRRAQRGRLGAGKPDLLSARLWIRNDWQQISNLCYICRNPTVLQPMSDNAQARFGFVNLLKPGTAVLPCSVSSSASAPTLTGPGILSDRPRLIRDSPSFQSEPHRISDGVFLTWRHSTSTMLTCGGTSTLSSTALRSQPSRWLQVAEQRSWIFCIALTQVHRPWGGALAVISGSVSLYWGFAYRRLDR